ncbi:tRNA-intron lyase [Saliphagus infecundisoli]|uniref:tRNA-splicing endonuclease n=1 Tax=Saliphagus infecundisoli TaxID=1849069 RepID=A0ABD5QJ11_9EURY|nr:tRNA-intron lyase [Saliphagus infecundisoli]
MELEGRFDGEVVRVAGDARQRFHDASGYGYPLEGNEIALAPVEAAHLLFRERIGVVADGERLDFRSFLAREPAEDFVVRYLVYADLRSRGFYLSPAREPWIEEPPDADFAVFPRGNGPDDGEVEYAVRAVGERASLPAGELAEGVLAVVDEESEITYFERARLEPSGTSGIDLPRGVEADLLEDRVVVWNPPRELYERGFYGQPLEGRDYDRPTLQCSLVEAAFLADRGTIDLSTEAVVDRGRAVEGERFDRRLAVYGALREAGTVPKTGYKFGADFRTYADVESVEELGHSELLVRVLPADHVFEPRDLALDVRLAHGVRKTMSFALVGEGIDWWSLERLTP